MAFTIYALVDPRDHAIRYVGCITAPYWGVRERVSGHVVAARAGASPPVSRWVRELLAADLRPAFTILGGHPFADMRHGQGREEASLAERKWIAKLRDEGAALLNVRPGGIGKAARSIRPLQPWSVERRAAHRLAVAKSVRGGIAQLDDRYILARRTRTLAPEAR